MEKHKFQAYLAIDGNDPAKLVLRPPLEPGEGYPANHVKLEGVGLDAVSCLDEGINFRLAGRVAELCRKGSWFEKEGETGAAGVSSSLWDAKAILNDLMSGRCGEVSSQVLMQYVMDRVVQAASILDKGAE